MDTSQAVGLIGSTPSWDVTDFDRLTVCPLCQGQDLSRFLDRRDGLTLVKCQRCGLVLVNPRPSWRQLVNYYDHRYFSGEKDFYRWHDYKFVTDHAIEHETLPGYALFKRHVPVAGKRLLEIGCGYGAFLVLAQRMGAEVVGLDISEHAAHVAREEYGLNVLCSTLEEAGFPDHHFEVVTFFDVLEHVPDPVSFVWEIVRILRPDGTLFFLVPNLARYDIEGEGWPGLVYHHEHLLYFRIESIQRLLQDCGLTIKKHWTRGVPGIPQPPQSERTGTRKAEMLRQQVRRLPGWRQFARTVYWLGRREWLESWRSWRGYGHNLIILAQRV